MSTYDLIHAVVNEDGESFLGRIAQKFTPKSKKKAEPPIQEPPKEDESPDVDTSVPLYSHFVDKFRRAGKGKTRVVLRMSQTDLPSLYLKQGGGADFVKALPDEVVKAIAKFPAHTDKVKAGKNLFGLKVTADFQALPSGYSFSQLITSPDSDHDVSVLLDIPDTLMAELVKAGKSADVNGARAALTKMMNHKYYVLTMSNSKAKKIASKVDAAFGDIDATANVLPPTVVIAYPNLRELKQIRTEWAEMEKHRESNPTQAPTKQDTKQDDDTAETLARAKKNMDAIVKDKADKQAQQPANETPPSGTSSNEPEDLSKLFGTNWEKFVQQMGGVDKNSGRIKNQKKIPAALRKQIYDMATAVGYNP